jgi:hypothetical protein
MSLFQDISRFSNTDDYLPILNGAILTDVIVIFMVIQGFIKSPALREWYNNYGISGVLADVLSITIGILIARLIYPFFFDKFNILLFLILAVLVQCIHDLVFSQIFYGIPKGRSRILDTFKKYADENGALILIADALMMISASILASLFVSLGPNLNIVLFIVLLYLVPYFIYSV